ncbi:MAG: hypothetical protein D6718_13255, partial [Acidobacteria bacterium]
PEGTVVARTLPKAPPVPRGEARRTIRNLFPDAAVLGETAPPRGSARGDGRGLVLVDPNPRAPAASFPAIDVRFDGPYNGGIAPPDPVMAAGSIHVVSLVNLRIAMYDKSGNLVSGPTSLRSFFGVPSGFSLFDPLAVHDPFSGHFIVTVLADNGSAQDSRIYIAFSQTEDASGAWNKYWIDADRGQEPNWADYASIGLDRNAVYLTANMFRRSDAFDNVTLFIYDKEDGYAGRPLDNTHIIDVTSASGGSPFRLRPAFIDEIVPNDEYYLAQSSSAFGDILNLFRLTGPRFGSPTLNAETVSLPAFYWGPGSARQPGGAGVDTLGGSVWNVTYHAGKLWTAHAVQGNSSIAAWVHRIDVTGPTAVREATYELEDPSRDTYFPYVIPDTEDNDFAMLSAFSGPSLYVTGRYWNIGADGTVRYAELLTDGTRDNNSGRHGDYFAMYPDPEDRNRLWMIAQYMRQSSFSGNQMIASVRFENVPAPSPPPPTPDGHTVPGSQVMVSRAGGSDLTITWGTENCLPPDNHLVWFDLGGIASYTVADETCSIGVSGSWTGPSPAGNVGVIVVSDDGNGLEGSHGVTSGGAERPSASSICATRKDTSGSCP